MKGEIEICTGFTGWRWKMPKLTHEMIEEYGLGTWDLADWVYGTVADLFQAAGDAYRMPFYAKVLWKIENRLRFWEWWAFFRFGHKSIIYRTIKKIRGGIFKIAWGVCVE